VNPVLALLSPARSTGSNLSPGAKLLIVKKRKLRQPGAFAHSVSDKKTRQRCAAVRHWRAGPGGGMQEQSVPSQVQQILRPRTHVQNCGITDAGSVAGSVSAWYGDPIGGSEYSALKPGKVISVSSPRGQNW